MVLLFLIHEYLLFTFSCPLVCQLCNMKHLISLVETRFSQLLFQLDFFSFQKFSYQYASIIWLTKSVGLQRHMILCIKRFFLWIIMFFFNYVYLLYNLTFVQTRFSYLISKSFSIYRHTCSCLKLNKKKEFWSSYATEIETELFKLLNYLILGL